jgi:hypothetical protein
MAKLLKDAIEEVTNLPESDQKKIGLGLLAHVERLRGLRRSIDEGIRSLEAGEGVELEIGDFIDRKKSRDGNR